MMVMCELRKQRAPLFRGSGGSIQIRLDPATETLLDRNEGFHAATGRLSFLGNSGAGAVARA